MPLQLQHSGRSGITTPCAAAYSLPKMANITMEDNTFFDPDGHPIVCRFVLSWDVAVASMFVFEK